MLATLMLPASALLVPTYLTVVDVPVVHVTLIDHPAAIWLPAAANALNIYVLKRFFDQISDELVDAARIDGAGPLRTLWYVILPVAWAARDQTLSIAGSSDCTTFSTIVSSAVHRFDPATGNTVTIAAPAGSRRFVRVNITANTGWPAAQLSSLEVYAS